MKYLSLFSGIGGFELGLQYAYEKNNREESARGGAGNGRGRSAAGKSKRDPIPVCIGYSEIDRHAKKVYASHFDHCDLGDVTAIDAAALPDFDMLVGGFPCQAFSVAGKRRGFDDTRGTLFFDIARILKAKRPRMFLLENVKGLLSHDGGRTFKTIVTTLAELGYDPQWQVLNSKNHGVPQNRERVIIAGYLAGSGGPQIFPLREPPQNGNESEASAEGILPLAQTLTARQFANWSGNYVQQVAQINEGQSGRIYGTDGISPTLSTMTGGGLKQPKILQRPRGKNAGGSHDNAPSLTGKSYQDNNHVAYTLKARADSGVDKKHPQTRIAEGSRIRRLTPIECERLQGFPDNWTAPASDTQRYKMCGNAVTTFVIADVACEMMRSYPLLK